MQANGNRGERQPYALIDRQRDLDAALAALASAPALAVDTEADSRHRYPEKVCLIQLSDGVRTYLVDALAGLDCSALGRLFRNPRLPKILHGADYDLRCLDRDFGFAFANCYDTSIAARFAGLERFGLAPLLEDVLGVSIPKDQRLRRADWSRRPLPPDALAYAAADALHLPALRDALDDRLRALGRREWVAEEHLRLAEVRHVPPDPEAAFLSVKGAHALDGRALAVLKALCAFRESEARRLNRPPGYVLSAQALVFLAANPGADLAKVPGLGPKLARRYGRAIRAALAEGKAAPPEERPRPQAPFPPRMTKEESAMLSRLKKWRAGLGADLRLDPSLLWPMRSLERLARAPRALDAELQAPEIRAWQRAQFAASLRKELAARSGAPSKSG